MYSINLTHFEAVKYVFDHHHSCDWREKARPYATIALMIEGTGEFVSANESFTIRPGDLVFIPDGINYISHWRGNPNSYLSIHFFLKSAFPQCEAQNFKLQRLSGLEFSATLKTFEAIRENLEKSDRKGVAAVSDFFSFYSDVAQRLKLAEYYSAAIKSVQPAIDYLETGAKEVNVGMMAELCHLSESRFYTLFKQATGLSPIRFKNNILIRRATQMLKSGMSVQDVSDELGFSAPSYFRRLFKQVTGKNPKEYAKWLRF